MARPTDWVDTTVNVSAATAAQGSLSLITGLEPSDMRGATVIRTIVRLWAHSTTVAGAWGVQMCDLAIGITSQEAFAASTFPDPSQSSEKPPRGWMYRTSVGLSQNGVGTTIMREITADVRAARKVENGEVFLVFDNTALGGTAFTVRVTGLVRLLIKLA